MPGIARSQAAAVFLDRARLHGEGPRGSVPDRHDPGAVFFCPVQPCLATAPEIEARVLAAPPRLPFLAQKHKKKKKKARQKMAVFAAPDQRRRIRPCNVGPGLGTPHRPNAKGSNLCAVPSDSPGISRPLNFRSPVSGPIPEMCRDGPCQRAAVKTLIDADPRPSCFFASTAKTPPRARRRSIRAVHGDLVNFPPRARRPRDSAGSVNGLSRTGPRHPPGSEFGGAFPGPRSPIRAPGARPGRGSSSRRTARKPDPGSRGAPHSLVSPPGPPVGPLLKKKAKKNPPQFY